MKKNNWAQSLPGLSVGVCLLFGSSVVYADMQHTSSFQPQMNLIQDNFNTEQKLNLSIYNPRITLMANGQFSQPMGFYVYSNYPNKIARYSITIYHANDKDLRSPLKTFDFTDISPYEALLWDGVCDEGKTLSIDSEYQAILTATASNGRQDTTRAVSFTTLGYDTVQESDFTSQPWSAGVTGALADDSSAFAPRLRGRLTVGNEIPGFGINQMDNQGIVAAATDRKVVVQLSGLYGLEGLMLNNEPLVVDSQGRAVREVILAPGEYTFNLRWTDDAGAVQTQTETLVIEKTNDVFFVGLAEVTYAQNNVSGAGQSILQDADSHHYSGKGSWDGRVAFYLKGNYDEVRVTAHLDTTETKLADAFGRMGDKDPTRFARELDPQAYYPIYGDDSTVENDVDTQGKFYVKLEKGKSYALWGNFNTQMTGTAYSDFNRSLYGAKLYHESENTTKFGDTKSYLTVFGSTGETRGSHNEFSSTGGSLYYLKHQRVTEGSLKLSVEIRDRNTGRVLSTQALSEGTDYEIDNFQGRVLLSTPLPMTASVGSGSSIIAGGQLLGGDNVWLIAEYEYYSDGFDMDGQKVYGARGYGWLNDHIRLGGSYVHEEQAGGEAYELQGLDVTLRPLKGTHTQLEYAMSDASNSDIFVSSNGGLGFSQVTLSGSTKGAAWGVRQAIDFNEYVDGDVPLTFDGYFSRKQAGFSSFSTARDSDLTEWGGTLRYDFEQDKKGLLVSYSYEEDSGRHLEKIARAQYFSQLTEMFSGALELQDRRENNYTHAGETKELLAAVKVEATLFDGRDKAYVIQQATVRKSGDISDNNKTTLGYQSQIMQSLSLGGEVFGSNRGAGGGVNAVWDVNERASLYTKVINDVDSNAGRGITTTVGQKMKATSELDIYSEKQFKSQSTERSTSDVYGVSYKPTSSQTIDASYSTGQVNDRNRNSTNLTGDSGTKRDVYLVGYGYKDERYQWRSKVEYRFERSEKEHIRQWVSTNRGKTIVSENWSWLGQFDIANTQGDTKADNAVVSDYLEAAVGFAYRPQWINNLNLFGKVTYVRGVDPSDQLIANTSSSRSVSYQQVEYDQKSWVWSLEGVYEWSQYWETAFKAAHRQGHLRYKGESEWFSSGASLYAARINFKYADFEYQVEGRTLRTSLADDHKDGVVLSVYRHIGDNAKIGVGYNFTDYNDNLTHMNYNAHGWFINVVGSF